MVSIYKSTNLPPHLRQKVINGFSTASVSQTGERSTLIVDKKTTVEYCAFGKRVYLCSKEMPDQVGHDAMVMSRKKTLADNLVIYTETTR